MKHRLSGFADEAGAALKTQIRATRELGWRHIEMRNVQVAEHPNANLHDIGDEAFAIVADKLEQSEISIHCFGTAIGKRADREADDVAAARRLARRAAKTGTTMARVMSYPIGSLSDAEVFRRLREIVQILADGGVQTVFENCGNYAGRGWRQAQTLVENVPGSAIAFDPGNCIGPATPYGEHGAAWEFYANIRPHIAHFHVKDARWEGKKIHTFPGEGEAEVPRITADLLATSYDGMISIEPHLGAISSEKNECVTYVEYGKRVEKLLDSISC